ncbi:MAG: DUF192 domain-containing protein [Nanoarchaeota archaeon]
MKRKNILLVLIFILIILLILIIGINFSNKKIKQVCFDKKCVSVEIADTDALREKGLMFRKYLNSDSGMLFIFEKEGIRYFWMKNTKIPLDIIWIDKNMNIIKIDNAVPCLKEPCEFYSSQNKVLYVLEVNSGFSNENDVKVGDKIRFDLGI